MTANSVEVIGEKVNRLISAYRSNMKELEELRSENSKLRNTINSSSAKNNSQSFETEQMKKKVDALILELDKCMKLMDK